MKILVTPTSFRPDSDTHAAALLKQFASEIVYNPLGRPLAAAEAIPLLSGADGWIAGLDYITAEVIAAAPASLKVISRYGAGYDRVDVQAAKARGIAVTTTPGVNAESVADLAIGLMLAVARRIPMLDGKVKSGGWPRAAGVELYGKTLGIVGFGAVGRALARRAGGFSMKVLVHDPYVDAGTLAAQGFAAAALDELLAGSDVVSLHAPLTDGTRHMIGPAALSAMKDGAILINTARGGLIDEAAVYEALKSGKLFGLGVDAFETEPPGQSPLLMLDSVVATPHAGAHTTEAVERMADLSVQNLIDVLSGRECRYILK